MKAYCVCVVLLAIFAVAAFGQSVDPNGYFNLKNDQFVPGGVNDSKVSTLFVGDKMVVSFPFELKLKMWFKERNGKKYQSTGKLHANEKLTCRIDKQDNLGNGLVKLHCTAQLANTCGNPFQPFSFTVVFTVGNKPVFKEVVIARPETVVVNKEVYIERSVPTPTDVHVDVEREQAPYELVLTGSNKADREWEDRTTLWDGFIGLLHEAAFPIGMIFRNGDNTQITAVAKGGKAYAEGGKGGDAISTTSSSAAASASAAAAAGSGAETSK